MASSVAASQHPSGADVDSQFLELVCADAELLDAEFEAIVAANWPPPASIPVGGPTGPRRAWARRRRRMATTLTEQSPRSRAPRRERSPPDRHLASSR